jgi:hypothetical protein
VGEEDTQELKTSGMIPSSRVPDAIRTLHRPA